MRMWLAFHFPENISVNLGGSGRGAASSGSFVLKSSVWPHAVVTPQEAKVSEGGFILPSPHPAQSPCLGPLDRQDSLLCVHWQRVFMCMT